MCSFDKSTNIQCTINTNVYCTIYLNFSELIQVLYFAAHQHFLYNCLSNTCSRLNINISGASTQWIV